MQKRRDWDTPVIELLNLINNELQFVFGLKYSEMKHIFLVHSYSTTAVAYAVIKHLDLRPEDVAIFYGRGFEIPNCEYQAFSFPRFKHWDALKRGSAMQLALCIGEYDDWFTTICEEVFELYIPQSANPAARLLMSSRLCLGYSYIEEGWTSFNDSLWGSPAFNWKVAHRRFLYPWRRYLPQAFFSEGYKSLYASSEESFPGRYPKFILKIDFKAFACTIPEMGQSNVSVFVLNTVEFSSVRFAAAYCAALTEVIDKEKSRGKTIYFKLHPAQYLNGEAEVFRSLFKRFDGAELPSSISLEALAVQYPNLKFIGLNSSVSFYIPEPKDRYESFLLVFAKYSQEEARKIYNEMPVHFHSTYLDFT